MALRIGDCVALAAWVRRMCYWPQIARALAALRSGKYTYMHSLIKKLTMNEAGAACGLKPKPNLHDKAGWTNKDKVEVVGELTKFVVYVNVGLRTWAQPRD